MIVTILVTDVTYNAVQVQKVHIFSVKSLCKYRALFRSLGKKAGFAMVNNR